MRSKKITPTRALMEILVHPDDLNEVWQVVEKIRKRRESGQKGLESGDSALDEQGALGSQRMVQK